MTLTTRGNGPGARPPTLERGGDDGSGCQAVAANRIALPAAVTGVWLRLRLGFSPVLQLSRNSCQTRDGSARINMVGSGAVSSRYLGEVSHATRRQTLAEGHGILARAKGLLASPPPREGHGRPPQRFGRRCGRISAVIQVPNDVCVRFCIGPDSGIGFLFGLYRVFGEPPMWCFPPRCWQSSWMAVFGMVATLTIARRE